MSQLFPPGDQSIGDSASASDLPVNIQDGFPLGLTGLISLQESSPTPQFKSINSLAHNLLYNPTLTSIHKYWKNHSFDYMDLCWESNVSAFYMLCRFVIAFFPEEQVSFNFMAAVIICSDFGAQENKACHCFHCFLNYLP